MNCLHNQNVLPFKLCKKSSLKLLVKCNRNVYKNLRLLLLFVNINVEILANVGYQFLLIVRTFVALLNTFVEQQASHTISHMFTTLLFLLLQRVSISDLILNSKKFCIQASMAAAVKAVYQRCALPRCMQIAEPVLNFSYRRMLSLQQSIQLRLTRGSFNPSLCLFLRCLIRQAVQALL